MIAFEQVRADATLGQLGLIPTFLSLDDPRSAAEQINDNYAHGGGWFVSPNMQRHWHIADTYLTYRGEETYPLLFRAQFRDETILVFDCAWVAIVQVDRSYEVSRID